MRMALGVRLLRGLSVVGFVLGGIVFSVVPAVVPAGTAYAQTANSIVVMLMIFATYNDVLHIVARWTAS